TGQCIMAKFQLEDDINKDLGLGSRVTSQEHTRFLNRDGSFNVQRMGLPFLRSINPYHSMITMSWWRFNAVILFFYLVINVFFALAYFACGPDALKGAEGQTAFARLFETFFFSVQTLSTIGYGSMSPNGLAANIVVAVEALAGLLGFALATGILFARFSRPYAKIVFSHNAVIAPYKGITAFEFRLANERSNELIQVEASVTFSRIEVIDGIKIRKFYILALERRSVVFLPLHWVVVHPIDETSPLYNVTKEQLEASDAEFLVLLTGTDETFAQSVHARTSYKPHEVVWGARFADVFKPSTDGILRIDLGKIHHTEQAG
ncbi:MAG TPA: ion channel, partial [Bacteroidota bacterium]|nr:ion channel [Bacteroidota bacterium]